jgi:hypothetical protein
MKKISFILLGLIFSCAPITDQIIFNNTIEPGPAVKKKLNVEAMKMLMIDDFSKKNINNLKGSVNPWAFSPDDSSQGCSSANKKDSTLGEKGTYLQIKYDVDSPNLAFNGVYWELKDVDFSSFYSLSFNIKGDTAKGFTSVLKLELKNNSGQVGVYFVQGITEEWQKITIPLSEFKGLTDLTSMKEFTVVFVDTEVTKKEGVLLIYDLAVNK